MLKRLWKRRVVLVVLGGAAIAFVAVALWAALRESDEERARHTWQVRLTGDGLDRSALSLDMRDTDQELEQQLLQLLKPAFELQPPRDTGEMGTISFKHTITQHVSTSGWEKLKNRIKSNLGLGYLEVDVSTTYTTTFERYVMPNPRGGGITTGFRTTDGELVANPDFSPGWSTEDRLKRATTMLVERLRETQKWNEPVMDDDFAENLKQQIERSPPSGSQDSSAPAPAN